MPGLIKPPGPLNTVHVATQEMNRRRKKFGAPELQFHASATLVMHGNPLSLKLDERNDLAGEIAQFCVPVDRNWVGQLKRHHVERVFENLMESCLKRLREHGVMASGQ